MYSRDLVVFLFLYIRVYKQEKRPNPLKKLLLTMMMEGWKVWKLEGWKVKREKLMVLGKLGPCRLGSTPIWRQIGHFLVPRQMGPHLTMITMMTKNTWNEKWHEIGWPGPSDDNDDEDEDDEAIIYSLLLRPSPQKNFGILSEMAFPQNCFATIMMMLMLIW